jgi:thiamine biosynthesis lipoprotein
LLKTHQITFRVLLFGLFFALTACGPVPSGDHSDEALVSATTDDSSKAWVITGPTMGTHYSIKLYPPSQLTEVQSTSVQSSSMAPSEPFPSSSTLKNQIDLLLNRVNDLMSTYKPNSELSRFNATPPGKRFLVSPETYQVLNLAQDIHHRSNGLFDVTVGPLVTLWGFGNTGRRLVPPAESEIQAALGAVDQSALLISLAHEGEAESSMGALIEENAQSKTKALYVLEKTKAVSVDLSAIAKGYGVDLVANYLRRLGVQHFLVEIGGEISTSGFKPRSADSGGKEPWRIALEVPSERERSVQAVLNLTDVAVATSGNYRNFFEHDNRRYGHSINPKTGWPVDHGLASATVLIPAVDTVASGWRSRTALADGWATALMVAGPQQARALVEQEQRAAILIFHGPDGRYTEEVSSQASAYLATQP